MSRSLATVWAMGQCYRDPHPNKLDLVLHEVMINVCRRSKSNDLAHFERALRKPMVTGCSVGVKTGFLAFIVTFFLWNLGACQG